MPVKDRLQELQKTSKYASEKDSNNETEMLPLQTQNMSNSCADFFHNFQETIEQIDRVSQNVSNIRHLHSKILYDFREDPEHKTRLEDLMAENKRLGMKIRASLKEEQDKLDEKAIREAKEAIKEDPKEKKKAKNQAKKQHELRLRKTQVTTQTKRFYEIWQQYNQEQLEYKERSKDILAKRLRTAGVKLSEDEVEDMLEQGKSDQIFSKSYMEQTSMAKKQLTELQDRHEDFLKLERSIREVHDLFLELGALVAQQGEVVDSIFHHVEKSTADVERGKGQLQEAEKQKKKARKLKVILAIVAIVLVLIVLLVVLSEFGAFGGSGETVIIKEIPVTESPTSSSTKQAEFEEQTLPTIITDE